MALTILTIAEDVKLRVARDGTFGVDEKCFGSVDVECLLSNVLSLSLEADGGMAFYM